MRKLCSGVFMYLEREAKFRLKLEPGFYIDYLMRFGFKLIDRIVELDTYFQHPCRDMASSDEALRLRSRRSLVKNTVSFLLCYKGPRRINGLFKEREEFEVEIKDMDIALNILNKLGFREVVSFLKYREVYVHERTKILIDHLIGVGWFMEIETDEPDFLEKFYRELRDHLEIVRETYLEICLSSGMCVNRVD